MKVIAVGDNIIDRYVDQLMNYPGGNALNVAVFSKRYEAKKSSYIGIIGNDEGGEHIEATLLDEEIDVSRLRKVIGESGKTKVIVNKEGDRVFDSWNYGGVQSLVKIKLSEEDINFIKEHQILHSSVYSYSENLLPLLYRHIFLSFDFSTKKDRSYLEKICPYLTFAFYSGSETSQKECLELINTSHKLGTSNVIITRGKKGALFSNGKNIYEQPSIETKVVDTLGAGDSFIAKFLIQFHLTNNPKLSLEKAVEAASDTCKYFGAFGYGKLSAK